ncbi:MAG: tauC [Hyphomicrobiales bacterium]|nr:tauC [Hyphomicrobiales bacterium]
MTRLYLRHQTALSALASFAVIILVWQLAVDLGYVKAFFVSTPTRIAAEFMRQLQTGELAANVSVSLFEFVVGLALAVAAGGALGVLASWSRTFEHVLEPFIWFKYSSPTIAFYPIFVAWLGLGEPTIIAIAFLFAVTPIYANTLSGIKHADPDLVRAAQSFGARRRDVFLKIALPGSAPLLIAGLRLAVGRALTGVVAAELFGATAGLGFSIAYYGQKLRTTEMMTSLVVVILLGVVLTQLLASLEARVDFWRTGPGR